VQTDIWHPALTEEHLKGKGLFSPSIFDLFFLLVFLLDPIAKFLQAGEQRGTAVREEDRLLLCLALAAVLFTHIAFQGGVKSCRLS